MAEKKLSLQYGYKHLQQVIDYMHNVSYKMNFGQKGFFIRQ